MRLRDLESRLQRLREEKEKFLELLHSTDKRLARGEITKYQRQFTIASITHGLSENEHLRMLDRDILNIEREIKQEIRSSPILKNILMISLGVILLIALLFFLIVPELLELKNANIKDFSIPVNATFDSDQRIYPTIMHEDGSAIRSMKLSGSYMGDVKVYMLSNYTGARLLIFDSAKYSQDIISITGNLMIINGDPSEEGIMLRDVCDETCKIDIEPEGIFIDVDLGDNSSFITIDEITYSQTMKNKPPVQVRSLDDITINDTTTVKIDLSAYFSDSESDVLRYSLSNIPRVLSKTEGKNIIITVPKGVDTTYSGFIYVSDGKERINSNVFKIVVNTTNPFINNTISDQKPSGSNNENDDKDDLPLVRTNRTVDQQSNLTNNTALNYTPSNRTIDINVPADDDRNIYTNNYWGESYATSFKIDSKLRQVWNSDPSASPRVLVTYKDGSTQDTNEYIQSLLAQIELEKTKNPQDFNKNLLLTQKAIIEKSIEINKLNSKNVISGNLITGNAIDDMEDYASSIITPEDELAQIDDLLEIIEIYEGLSNEQSMDSVYSDPESGVEVLDVNFTLMLLLRLNDQIDTIYIDEPVASLMQESMNLTNILMFKEQANYSYDGSGTIICLVDTGMNTTLIPSYVEGYNFVDDNYDMSSSSNHAASIASILYSAAPGARIILAKVLSDNGTGYESQVLSGLAYCEYNNATIISMSLGSLGYNGYCDNNPVSKRINYLATQGILTVAATGNDANSLVKVPACAASALAVGSSGKDDSFSAFTSANNNTLLLAPGQSINTIGNDGLAINASGTSISVPFVSAVAALLYDSVYDNETYTIQSIKDRIIHTGKLIEYNGRNYSRIDAYNAFMNNITNDLQPQGINSTNDYEECVGDECDIIFEPLDALSSCGNLTTANTTYDLTQNITASGNTCINIMASGIALDCNGYFITGDNTDEAAGVHTNNTDNVTIRNCNIRNFTYGISYNTSTGGAIYNNNISIVISNGYGIQLRTNSHNNNITSNNINTSGSSGYGIRITSGNNNTYMYNTIFTMFSSSRGIYLSSGDSNRLFYNILRTNGTTGQGIYLDGSASNNNISFNFINTTNSNAHGIYLSSSGAASNMAWFNSINTSGSTAHPIYITSDNNTAAYNRVNASGADAYGILVVSCENNTVANNTVSTSDADGFGIYLAAPLRTSVYNNTVNTTGTSGHAMVLYNSSGNTIFSNLFAVRTVNANFILVSTSQNNTFYYNNLTGNGIWVNESNSSSIYTNKYNTSVAGVPQGNYYSGLNSYIVYDTNADGWGDAGSQYPLNRSTNATRWLGNGSDFGPATTQTAPECQNITTAGTTITLGKNLQINGSSCFNVYDSNVKIDCGGFVIKGNNVAARYGVYSNASNTTITNCIFNNWTTAIWLNRSRNSLIQFNRFNLGTSSSVGVLIRTTNNSIVDNNIINNTGTIGVGVNITNSRANNVTSNNITNTGTLSDGISLNGGANTTIVRYNIVNVTNTDATAISIINNSRLNNIILNTVYTSGTDAFGIHLFSTANTNNLTQNNITGIADGGGGVRLFSSTDDNIISLNNIVTFGDNGAYGITISSAPDNNMLRLNNINTSGSSSYGIRLFSSPTRTTADQNNITTTGTTSYGIHMQVTTINTIMRNIVTTTASGSHGIYMHLSAQHNNITGNTINTTHATTAHLALATSATNNTVYHNTIIGTGEWVDSLNDENKFNISIAGVAQGNNYSRITDYLIFDSNGDGWGDTGAQYPMNVSTNSSLWTQEGSDFGPVTTATARTSNPRILPSPVTTIGNMLGYCNATGVSNVLYHYIWYMNNTVNATGNTSNYTSDIEVNVANISAAQLNAGQNWTFSCMAQSIGINNTWRNSTPTIVQAGYIVSGCTNISSSGTYSLNQTIVPGGLVCINITASNVTLDCNYKTLVNTSYTNTAIRLNAFNNTVKNCIINVSTSAGRAFMLFRSNYSSIFNNNISAAYGIASSISSFSNISNNNMSVSLYGFQSLNGSVNIIRNNIIHTYLGGGTFGIAISGNQSNMTGNFITNAQGAIILREGSRFNTIENNNATASAIFIYMLSQGTISSVNNTLRNNNLINSSRVIFASQAASCDNNWTNTSIGDGVSYLELYNYSFRIENRTSYGIVICDADVSNMVNITLINASTYLPSPLEIYAAAYINISGFNSTMASGEQLYVGDLDTGRLENILSTSISISTITQSLINNVTLNQPPFRECINAIFADNNTWSNILVSNCTDGISLSTSNNNTFTNVLTRNNSGSGIYITSSPGTVLNNVSSLHNVDHGIELIDVWSANITGAYVADNKDTGIYLQNASGIRVINYTMINNSNKTIHHADIYLNRTTSNAYFQNGFINSTNRMAITVHNASNVTFVDLNITGNATFDVNAYAHSNTSYINASYSTENLTGTNTSIYRKWKYIGYTNFSNGTLLNTSAFNIYNSIGILSSPATNGTGYAVTNLTEYYRSTTSTVSYYNNYSMNVSYNSQLYSRQHNLTIDRNIDEFYTFNATNPTCQNITVAGLTTIEQSEIINDNDCISITVSNVVLDCAGYTLTGNNASGTQGVITNRNNVTVKNCIIQGFASAIFYNDTALNGNITNNSIRAYAGTVGIFMRNDASYNNIADNHLITSGAGTTAIRISPTCDGNNITNNKVNSSGGNGFGVYISSSSNTIIAGNNITTQSNSAHGVYLDGSSTANTITRNNMTISGASSNGVYLFSASDRNAVTFNIINVTSGAGGIRSLNSDTQNISNNTIYTTDTDAYGIQISTSNSCNISGNYIYTTQSGADGIQISGSENNTISANIINVSSSSVAHIALSVSGNNTMYHNIFNGSARWINDSNNTRPNKYNTSIAGVAQGNYYSGIVSYEIYDSDSDGWGDIGSQHPLNATTVSSKWTGNGSDFRPATTRTPPTCQNITTHGYNLTLLTNQQVNDSTCINVFANNVIVDCSGYAIIGNNATEKSAIYSNSTNTTVQNCNITQFIYGVYFNGTRNGTIRSNNITLLNRTSTGVYLFSGANATKIHNNDILVVGANGYGVYLNLYSIHNNISMNKINTTGATTHAIYVDTASYNNASFNNITTYASTGAAIYFNDDSNNSIIDQNIIFTNGTSGFGVNIRNSIYSSVTRNNINTRGTAGIGIRITVDASSINATNNYINTTGSIGTGVLLFSNSDNSIIMLNTIQMSNSNDAYGVYIHEDSSNNNISLNNITTITHAVYVNDSNNNRIASNNINSSSAGVAMQAELSSNTTFYYNNITGTGPWTNATNYTMFNISVGGVARGNYYSRITDYAIFDTDGDGWGDAGPQYPLNSSTNSSIWLANGSDFGPATTRTYPSCQNITASGSTVTLYSSIQSNDSTCISVYASNVVIDCAGYTINGNNATWASAIYSNSSNTTVQNCIINQFIYGIYYNVSRNGLAVNNTVTLMNSSAFAISLYNSNNTRIINNSLNVSGFGSDGVHIVTSFNDTMQQNNIIATGSSSNGIYLFDSNINNITQNVINTSGNAVGVYALSDSNNNAITQNNIRTVGSSGFGIYITTGSDGNNVTANNINTLGGSGHAIRLFSAVSHTTIRYNKINTTGSTARGILLFTDVTNNTVSMNAINTTNSNSYGIYLLDNATDNVVSFNNISTNSSLAYGIYVNSSSSRNNITNNSLNVLEASTVHIMIENSGINRIHYNNLTGTGLWVNATNNTNMFNTSVGAVAQGNYYSRITDYQIFDSDSDGWADSGSQFPLNSSTNITIWPGNGTDFGPWTTRILPTCQNITTAGSTLTIYSNIQVNGATCINVFASNVVVDCSGYTITGNNATETSAIYSNSTNTTIQNCNITQFLYGIRMNLSQNGTLYNNTITLANTTAKGIDIKSTNYTRIISNNINLTGTGSYGISLDQTSGFNNIINNDINVSGYGLQLLFVSTNNNISYNRIRTTGSNGRGIYFQTAGNRNNITYNSISTTGTSGIGIFANSNSNSVLIHNNTVTTTANSATGILLLSSLRSIVADNNVSTTGSQAPAIHLYIDTNDNNITGNRLNASNTQSVHIQVDVDSVNNTFHYNNLTGSSIWVNDTTLFNSYNSSVGGVARGNYYSRITDYAIFDSNGDGWGDAGPQYPLNRSTNSSIWLANGSDFGPATTIATMTLSATILPSIAYTNDTLIGYCSAYSASGVLYYYTWFLNGAVNTTGNTSNYTSGFNANVANISSSYLSGGQNWTLECMPMSVNKNGTRMNSSTIMIQGIGTPSLFSPTNNNYTLTSRQPTFIWNNSAGASWYEINITSNNCASLFSNNTNIGATQSNYTPTSELCLQTEGGINTHYNWTVRACNSQQCSPWTPTWNFSIEPYLAITMTNNIVSFPTFDVGTGANTSNLSISPFTFQNDGNVYANITNMTINESLWIDAALGTHYFQLQAGNTSENGSFNEGASVTSWFNASSVNNGTIRALDYHDYADSAYVHTLVEVPMQEPPGAKRTFITFNWIER